jgi:hypothetical protein
MRLFPRKCIAKKTGGVNALGEISRRLTHRKIKMIILQRNPPIQVKTQKADFSLFRVVGAGAMTLLKRESLFALIIKRKNGKTIQCAPAAPSSMRAVRKQMCIYRVRLW